jgi:hypothetical protein
MQVAVILLLADLLTNEGEVHSVHHFYRRAWIIPPTQMSALHKAAFCGLVAQIGGIVEKFGRFYPAAIMWIWGKF